VTSQIALVVAASALAALALHFERGRPQLAHAIHPLDDHFDIHMPRYPGVSEVPLGETLEPGEGPMKMSFFSTTDSPRRVASFYQTVFEQEGLAAHSTVTSEGGVVGTFDPRVGAARSITILPHRGKTWVFPSVVDRPLDSARRGDMGQAAGLPVYPGSSRGLTLRASDHGAPSLVATYSNAGSLEENVRFYRRELAAAGWQENPMPGFAELEDHQAFGFFRGDEELSLGLTPVDGGGGGVVVSMVLLPRDGGTP